MRVVLAIWAVADSTDILIEVVGEDTKMYLCDCLGWVVRVRVEELWLSFVALGGNELSSCSVVQVLAACKFT